MRSVEIFRVMPTVHLMISLMGVKTPGHLQTFEGSETRVNRITPSVDQTFFTRSSSPSSFIFLIVVEVRSSTMMILGDQLAVAPSMEKLGKASLLQRKTAFLKIFSENLMMMGGG